MSPFSAQLFSPFCSLPWHNGLHELLEALSGVQADDGRWRFLGTQAMVVAGVGHGAADHLVVLRQAIGQAGDGRDVQLGTSLEDNRVKKGEVEVLIKAENDLWFSYGLKTSW